MTQQSQNEAGDHHHKNHDDQSEDRLCLLIRHGRIRSPGLTLPSLRHACRALYLPLTACDL